MSSEEVEKLVRDKIKEASMRELKALTGLFSFYRKWVAERGTPLALDKDINQFAESTILTLLGIDFKDIKERFNQTLTLTGLHDRIHKELIRRRWCLAKDEPLNLPTVLNDEGGWYFKVYVTKDNIKEVAITEDTSPSPGQKQMLTEIIDNLGDPELKEITETVEEQFYSRDQYKETLTEVWDCWGEEDEEDHEHWVKKNGWQNGSGVNPMSIIINNPGPDK